KAGMNDLRVAIHLAHHTAVRVATMRNDPITPRANASSARAQPCFSSSDAVPAGQCGDTASRFEKSAIALHVTYVDDAAAVAFERASPLVDRGEAGAPRVLQLRDDRFFVATCRRPGQKR